MPLKTPICDFGQAAKSFELKSTNNEIIKLNDVKGINGTLVMFICNHCPYVKAVIKDIVEDCKNLEKHGVKIAIDPLSQTFLTKCKLEFIEELGSAYFQISNPNVTAKCGCGNSFNI